MERGLEHELGAVIRHGLAQPGCNRWYFGRSPTPAGMQFDPLTRLTNSDIIACHHRAAARVVQAR